MCVWGGILEGCASSSNISILHRVDGQKPKRGRKAFGKAEAFEWGGGGLLDIFSVSANLFSSGWTDSAQILCVQQCQWERWQCLHLRNDSVGLIISAEYCRFGPWGVFCWRGYQHILSFPLQQTLLFYCWITVCLVLLCFLQTYIPTNATSVK